MGLFGFWKKKKDKKEDKSQSSGGFVGFVLLSEPHWDRQQLVKDLMADWGIDASERDAADGDQDILFIQQGKMSLAISFMAAPVPGGEAEHYAAANYLWPGAVETTQGHKAQLLVAVLGAKSPIERGKLFVKGVSSCLKQPHAVAVYTDGAVFQPEFYQDFAQIMKKDALPIMNWVWLGLYRDEKQAGLYTYGMRKFGRDEMEVYVPRDRADLGEIRNFLVDIVHYVLDGNVTLKDGETIGFSAEQKLPITRSKGIGVDGDSLKIGYPG